MTERHRILHKDGTKSEHTNEDLAAALRAGGVVAVFSFYQESFDDLGNGEEDCWCEWDPEEIDAFLEEEE